MKQQQVTDQDILYIQMYLRPPHREVEVRMRGKEGFEKKWRLARDATIKIIQTRPADWDEKLFHALCTALNKIGLDRFQRLLQNQCFPTFFTPRKMPAEPQEIFKVFS